MSCPGWREAVGKVVGPPALERHRLKARAVAARAAGHSNRRTDRDPRYAMGRAGRCSRRSPCRWQARWWAGEGGDGMSIVMGLDQHRAQITAEWIDTSTGEVSRGRVTPLIALACAGSSSVSPARSSRWRWRRRPAGGSWSRSCAALARRCIWPSRRETQRSQGQQEAREDRPRGREASA